jgi:ribonuclease HI
MAQKNRFYVVWNGKTPGIYPSWAACKAQIEGFPGARYMGFPTREAAEKAYQAPYEEAQRERPPKKGRNPEALRKAGAPNFHSIAVDAASSGNPGVMEYQGVDTRTGRRLFRQGPFPEGTNNIGEFLAIVHGLAYLKKEGSDRILYSDSKTAIGWVKRKKCNTRLQASDRNRELFEMVRRAELWLRTHSYTTPVVKWETRAWGEIPADFGRK